MVACEAAHDDGSSDNKRRTVDHDGRGLEVIQLPEIVLPPVCHLVEIVHTVDTVSDTEHPHVRVHQGSHDCLSVFVDVWLIS